MARPAQITRDNLAPLIRARGPVSATELAAVLRVNRTTIARVLSGFGDDLVTLGATRSTRYLLRRGVRHVGARWPLYRIGEDGRASEWAELEAFHDRWWRVSWVGSAPEWAGTFVAERGLWDGFPFFLADLRPQGFLGRVIATQLGRRLEVSTEPRQWSDEDVVVFLHEAGEDLPGNVVLGRDAVRRALAGAADLPTGRVVAAVDREGHYGAQALEATQSLPGSSAGGEQPKFMATLREAGGTFRSVLVKFTAPLEQETARRWADLLVCEHHAHEVLAGAGLSNAGTRWFDSGGRRFLEIGRFDRCGASGRRGVVSLEALTAATTGLARDWAAAGAMLRRRGLIDDEALAVIHRLQAFGEWTGNTDMHAGNLALFLDDALPLRVAPSYDMLPMLWAPGSQGEIVDRRFAPAPPPPDLLDPWRQASAWAEEFWQRIVDEPAVTPGFARLAGGALQMVRAVRRKFC